MKGAAIPKFICIHPRFAGLTSHHFNECAGLIQEFERRQRPFSLLINIRASARIAAELGARPVLDDPTFRTEWSFDERSRRFSDMLHLELDAELNPDDRVMITVSTQVEALALTRWLQEMAPECKPWIVILFISDRWNRSGRDEYERQISEFRTLNATISLLRPEDARRLIFCAPTELLADEMRTLLGAAVNVAPMPLPYGDPELYRSILPEPLLPRVAVLGGMRREKGSHLIPEIVRCCRSCVQVEFLIHLASDTLTADEVNLLAQVAQQPHVTVIREPMSLAEYNSALLSADLALFPYEIIPYRKRTSGVFAEAVAYGKPVLAPRGTWMAEQIEAGRAAGTIFEDLRPESIARAIAGCITDLDHLKQTAVARSVAWRQKSGPSEFVNFVERQILLRSSV